MAAMLPAFLLGVGAYPAATAHAQASQQQLSAEVEIARVGGVGAAWVSVATLNTYVSPVVACTYVLPSASDPPATVRMRNAGPTGFDIRIQRMEASNLVTASDVHCLVVEEGAHTLPGGQTIEAHTVLSDQTSNGAPNSNWNNRSENVTSTLVHSYTNANFVVLGQVMTFNDARVSEFWTHDGVARGNDPTPSAFFVGKHTGQSNVARADETLGFITMPAGSGTANGVDYVFAKGADSVAGVGNAPPYGYTLSGDFDTAVATQVAEDGGNGGWAVLYGADPLPPGRINLAIDEDDFAGDTTRTHTNEKVFYAAFDNTQAVDLDASKSLAPVPGPHGDYALPGQDVLYTLEVENTGLAAVDADGLFLSDPLPFDVSLMTTDMDGPGPATGSVLFEDFGSGLTFDPGTDVAYSDAVAAPTGFADCDYSPVAAYDPAIRHLCLRPGGRLGSASFGATPRARFTFRVQID